MEDFRKESISKYKKIISIPSVDQAYFVGENAITVTSSQTDINNKKTKNFISHKFIGKDGDIYSSPFNIESVSSSSMVSASKLKWVQIKEVTSAISTEIDSTSSYSFDVYSKSNLITSIQSKDLHRGICFDEWFGRPIWSPCERYIAYIADAKSNSAGFFDKDPKEKVVGDQFILKEDWGETYVGVTSPSIYILDLQNEEVIPIEPFPSKLISAGQITWSPESGLVFVGWDVTVRKLGIRACYNRISSLYYFDLQSFLKERESLKNVTITPKPKPTVDIISLLPNVKFSYFRSPRFTLDGKELVFLGFDTRVLAHNSCSKLFKLKWNSGKVIENNSYQVVVGEKNFKDEFKGIYNVSLPSYPFINEDTLLFSTNVASVQCLISVNISTSKVSIINDHNDIASVQLLDINRSTNQLLLGISTPTKPTLVVLSDYNNGKLDTSKFKVIHENTMLKDDLNVDFKVSLIDVPVTDNDSPGIPSFQVIYLKQYGDEKRRLMLYPHGGPHSAFTTEYSFALAFLMAQGYNIALVNFRGSTGFGKDFIECLPGKCGKVDVKDCLDTVDYLLKTDSTLDPEKVSVIGGSHSGFLAAHLSIDNKRFKVSIMRNPVIDIVSMSTQSDIPDWCYYESGILPNSPEDRYYHVTPTIPQLELMRNCSPIVTVDQVKIPTLILLGNCDLRVPFSQGLLFYRALKEQNKAQVQCNMYPKAGHSLDTVECKLDQWIQIVCWLEKYLSNRK